ncbi:hypothetical protein H6F67_12215 [Microcoleus sp. FACHB-1515]|uniref:hypothetical protein n=1 Tax=Microcoleus sp. FACHB-1515 TaxID=2692821 RepID=UPI001682F5F1|nr:hypothetical protein [Microcoleus sp. FACHB-1515]MBD2090619.1 hypothetical protein [Microcoleus sp. FACHB-1515]
MKLNFPIFKPLFWVSRRASWVCRFWGRGILINRWLLEHEWLAFDRAVQIQSWLIAQIHAEQKYSCRVHLKVLESCFASGDIPSLPNMLEYFQELRCLYDEGRYETMLIQLYQLDRSDHLDDVEDDTSTQLSEP